MIDKLLAKIAPYYCCGCGEMGSVLCHSCINDIVSEPFSRCIACTTRPARSIGLCGICHPPYTRAWVGGVHEGALDRVIDEFKFNAARGATRSLVELLHQSLPHFPDGITMVPIPTINKHVRERGFDHMKLLTKQLARRKSVAYDTSLLMRQTATVQRGASSKVRRRQAQEAFLVRGALSAQRTYILIDDVMTTGATLWFAAKALRNAGATSVWIIAIARQTLPPE